MMNRVMIVFVVVAVCAGTSGQRQLAARLSKSNDMQRGAMLYAQNCASCHGAQGKGDGTQAAGMLPKPTDLTAERYSMKALSEALYYGVPATPMPSFNRLPVEDLRA